MSGIPLQPSETSIFRIVRSIIQLYQGRSDAVGEVTLAAGQTSTFVEAVNCGSPSKIFLSPQTLHAAGALATTFVKDADIGQGGFTITHANAGTTDRTFSWLAIG